MRRFPLGGTSMARSTKVRKGMPSVQLTKAEFAERFRSRFYDPAFDAVASAEFAQTAMWRAAW
jgi:hypothetical protein